MKKWVLGLTVFALTTAPRLAAAQINPDEAKAKWKFPDQFGGADVPTLIGRIIAAVFSIVGALFFVMFLYGGFQYLTAGGDAKQVEGARKTLVNTVIGMLIIALSYVLVDEIIDVIIAGSQKG